MTYRDAFQPKLFNFPNKNDCETVLSGVSVFIYTYKFAPHSEKRHPSTSHCTTPEISLKHSVCLEGLISLVLWNFLAEPAQDKQIPFWQPRHRLCQSTAHNMHTGNKQIWGTICHAPSMTQPWQPAHTPPWCCLGSGLQCCAGLCFSARRLWKFPLSIVILVEIHVTAALISLDLPLIKTR